ncbi:MAG: methyltransferase [Methanomassiliicoccales archaeon]
MFGKRRDIRRDAKLMPGQHETAEIFQIAGSVLLSYIIVVLIPFAYIEGSELLTPYVGGAFEWTRFDIFPWNFVAFSLLFLFGSFWIIWSMHYTQRKRVQSHLLAEGPYAYCRNPRAFGYLVVMLGLGILIESAVAVFLLFPAMVICLIVYFKLFEEPLMYHRLGAAYQQYRESVSLLLPVPRNIRRRFQ